MKNQPSYFTGCIGAIEKLKSDVQEGQIVVYHIEQLPPGILPSSLAEKCSSAMVGLSSNGISDYLAIIPQRIDLGKYSTSKVVDSDPIIFATVADKPEAFPTGIFFHHSNYEGRTQPISGFEEFTCEQTVASLKQTLTTGAEPLSAAKTNYLEAFAHGIKLFTNHFETQLFEWTSKMKSNEDVKT